MLNEKFWLGFDKMAAKAGKAADWYQKLKHKFVLKMNSSTRKTRKK